MESGLISVHSISIAYSHYVFNNLAAQIKKNAKL